VRSLHFIEQRSAAFRPPGVFSDGQGLQAYERPAVTYLSRLEDLYEHEVG
jgi:hypothetical protein